MSAEARLCWAHTDEKGWLRCTLRMDDLAGCDVSLGAWPRLPTLPPPPPPLTQFAESPKRLGAGRAWLWRAALALLVLIPLLAELPQAAAQTVPTLKVEIPTLTEGETGTITLTLSPASSQDIDVTVGEASVNCGTSITCPQGTSGAGSNDYSRISETITFAAGETTKTVSFTATDDSMSEMTELFFFAVGDLRPSEATIDPDTPPDVSVPSLFWLVRIQDNDNPANPNVTIAPGTSAVTEGTAATFTVTATPAPTAATSVSVVVTEETSGGQDFVASSNETTHTVSIPASGSPGAGTGRLTIATVGDATQELHGAVTATVSDGTGYTVGNPSSATVTVHDDDGTPLPPEISVSLPSAEGVSPVDGKKPREESVGSAVFNLSANQVLTSTLTVCVRVTESGHDRVTSGNEGIKTVSLTSSGNTNGTGIHTLAWTDTAADDPDSSVTVEALAPNTNGCSATNGSYTVSSSAGADTVLIQDDEETTVSLTSTDMTMTEGDATDTATLTVSLDRRLYAGETIGVPIALATTTMARLPGSVDGNTVANHDFEVTAAAASMNSGVTLANALTANPRVVFTGHDSNTVQTATVTLTPVANRDDGDAAHETITATLASLGLVDTTVSGGVTAHATNNAKTLSLEDDEAAPAACSAQNTMYSEVNLRILENGGVATYCMRLTTAPSGGDTIVTLGRGGANQWAANFSPASLTFTSSNYMTPQQVTVTGVDEPNTHRNRPDMRVTHTANGGGYTNDDLGWVQVEVDDAPELEAWDTAVWNVNDFAAKQRPNTVKATRGFRYFWNDFAPITGLWYRLRLSNRPETGGTVTVTVTSSDPDKFGLALRPSNTPQATLTVTFEDREADPGCHNGGYNDIFENRGVITPSHGQIGEDRDNTPDTSWRCYRRIWVINVQDRNDQTALRGCSTISHMATGGGLRPTYVGSIRAHAIAGAHVPSNAGGTGCPRITGTDEAGDDKNYNPQASPARAAPAPTEAVSNVQVTAVDDASVSVTWDAVEHATSYEVSWSAESSDSLSAIAGTLPSVSGTTATIQHDASEPMTLTVTVTPEYVDKNGDTQQLSSLAGTATLDVGPVAQDAQAESAQATVTPPPDCVSDALLNKVRHYYDVNKHRAPGYGKNWRRVLLAFGDLADTNLTPFTAAEAKIRESRWFGWKPVRVALECIEAG